MVDFSKTPQNQCDWAGIAAKLPTCAVEPVRRILAVSRPTRGYVACQEASRRPTLHPPRGDTPLAVPSLLRPANSSTARAAGPHPGGTLPLTLR